ncbi:hypothetical protein [Pseudonocardia sp. HH130629-09]|uniref:hypothetical protein n=1 Tax=Pseudonocardia sp. HH130629-09 TaxID=1641402 RepID=UPI0011AEA7BA|nr:hypothetical protein [Pseudonocardia sp. HH130629-09]
MDDTPRRDQATAALHEIEAARRAVDATDRRARPAILLATSALTFVDFAAKDHVSRPAQYAVTALVQTGLLAMTLAETRTNPVVPYEPADGPSPGRAAMLFGSIATWMALERTAVALIRRSRVRRPNTVAGFLLSVTRPAGFAFAAQLMPRAGRHV